LRSIHKNTEAHFAPTVRTGEHRAIVLGEAFEQRETIENKDFVDSREGKKRSSFCFPTSGPSGNERDVENFTLR